MKKKKPTAMYRSLLREALRLTWHRKSLWVFGLLAGLLSTGGVCEVVLRSFHRVEQTSTVSQQIMQGTFTGYDWFGAHIRLLETLPSEQLTFLVTFLTLVGIAIFCAAVTAQAALITGIDRADEATLSEAVAESSGHFWPLVVLNLFVKISFAALLLISALPLLLIDIDTVARDNLFHGLFILLFFPAVMVITVVSQIALIATVREGAHALDAIHRALRLVRHHWLAALEYSIILFFGVLSAGIALFCALILLAIPFSLLLGIAVAAGLPFLFAIVNTVGAVLFFTAILCYAGASIAFQYAAWIQFYHKALHGGRQPLRSKLHRALSPLWAK